MGNHEKGHWGQLGRIEASKRHYQKNKEEIIKKVKKYQKVKCECGNFKTKGYPR